MHGLAKVLALACLVAGCSSTKSAIAPTSRLRVDGDVTARTLSVEDLEGIGLKDVQWDPKGESHAYRAVPLENVLRCVGIGPGEMSDATNPSEKRSGWKLAVVATATDGFQAVFSVAEVFKAMGRTDAYVATRENGNPLDASVGPFRLVVPTDGEGSRSVRNLERLTVLDLRKVLRPPSGAR